MLAVAALLKWMVNELPATLGTADRIQTPARSCCMVASIRLDEVSATPVLVADDFPAATVRTPLRLKTAGPWTSSATAPMASTPSPAAHSPRTPTPDPTFLPATAATRPPATPKNACPVSLEPVTASPLLLEPDTPLPPVLTPDTPSPLLLCPYA